MSVGILMRDHIDENNASFSTGGELEEVFEHLFCWDVSGIVGYRHVPAKDDGQQLPRTASMSLKR